MLRELMQHLPRWMFSEQPLPANTPDLNNLNQADDWFLFEYGDMREGMAHHSLINRQEPVCTAFTQPRLSLWTKNQGAHSFPIALKLPPPHPHPRSRVEGELYLIPANHFINLDRQRRNGVQFIRKMVPLICPILDDRGEPVVAKAFMYVGVKEHWAPQIDWDSNFRRERNGSAFTFIPPVPNLSRHRSHIYSRIGDYSFFNRDNYKESDSKCFIGLSDGHQQQDK